MVDSSALLQVKNTHHSDDSVMVIYSRSYGIHKVGSNNHADVYSYGKCTNECSLNNEEADISFYEVALIP